VYLLRFGVAERNVLAARAAASSKVKGAQCYAIDGTHELHQLERHRAAACVAMKNQQARRARRQARECGVERLVGDLQPRRRDVR